jgi:hypothetical protein
VKKTAVISKFGIGLYKRQCIQNSWAPVWKEMAHTPAKKLCSFWSAAWVPKGKPGEGEGKQAVLRGVKLAGDIAQKMRSCLECMKSQP